MDKIKVTIGIWHVRLVKIAQFKANNEREKPVVGFWNLSTGNVAGGLRAIRRYAPLNEGVELGVRFQAPCRG